MLSGLDSTGMSVKIIIFAPEAVWQRRAGLTAHPALTSGSAVTQG